jgi:hypothetical protein
VDEEYDVTIKTEGDDSHEAIYSGNYRECHIFMDGYFLSMLTHTHYMINERDLKADYLKLYSPLVSEPPITLEIIKKPPPDAQFHFNDGMHDHEDGHPMDFGDN